MTPFLLYLACFVLVVAIYLWKKLNEAEAKAALLESSLDSVSRARLAAERTIVTLERTVADLQAAVDRLAVFSNVADAADEAARILSDAQAASAQLTADANRFQGEAEAAAAAIRDKAKVEVAEIVLTARQRAEAKGLEAEKSLEAAKNRADAIVAEAERRSEEIAGEALRAMRGAEQWERTVEAMKNIVDGYGNRYVVPTHTLLDQLAEAFSHDEAGRHLKLIREQIRRMSSYGTAANCDYVEQSRRETAIRFVIDAFNGKAESILSRVKVDNIGTLQRELQDAFQLVNHNGAAFRSARVTEEYLRLRLEELRLAGVMEAMKVEEREQQRVIKEKIREEEKARREIERVLRESAKEEEIVRKAMAKAEEKLATATEAQRAKYEGQLEELRQKLVQAETANQRAKSMAELTRRGHVYIISNWGSFGDDVYKIGMTRRLDPIDRVRELGDSSVPFEFDVHAMIFSEDAPALESRLHRHFALGQVNKVNHRKEFFRLSLTELRQEVELLGLTANWTMTAAARQYRESLAIEQRIATDPAARDAWLQRTFLLEKLDDAFATDEAEPESAESALNAPSLIEHDISHPATMDV